MAEKKKKDQKRSFHNLLFAEEGASKLNQSSQGVPNGGATNPGGRKVSSEDIQCKVCKKSVTPPIVICKYLHYMCLSCRSNPHECPICKQMDNAKKASAVQSRSVPFELECPVCLDTLSAPIVMCSSGHNICGTCRLLLDQCPTCGQKFLNIRNRALEGLAENFKGLLVSNDSHCVNAPLGCRVALLPSEVQAHKEICLYRPRKCPLSKFALSACDWNDAYFKMKEHIESEHKDKVTCFTSEKKVHMKHFDYSKKCSRILFACNEIFYQQFEVKDEIFYFVVQHLVPGNSRKKYLYNLSINGVTQKKNQGMNFVSKAQSFDVDLDQIYMAGECPMIHFNMIKNLMEGKDIFEFTIEISKDDGKNKQTKSKETQ